MKILGAATYNRLISVFLILLPLTIIAYIIIIKRDFNLLYSNGYVIFFIVYFIYSFFYLKWTVFDASIYKVNNFCVISKLLFKKKEYENVSKVSVKPILFLSLLFKLYQIKINEDFYQVRSSVSQNFYDRLFHQKKEAHKLQELLTSSIMKNSY